MGCSSLRKQYFDGKNFKINRKNSMECWNIIGICIEKRILLGDFIISTLGIFGILGVYFAYRQLRLGQRAQQTGLLIQLHHEFYDDKQVREFIYRLDYARDPRAWKFEPETFRFSQDEDSLDTLLYRLSFIGSLVKNGDLHIRDLEWLKADIAIILENEQVLDYLGWLQSPGELVGHSSFSGAIFLYLSMFGPEGASASRLRQYLKRARV
jgi:hypothetical protein